LKANTGLAARVIRVARVNAFIGRDLVGRVGLWETRVLTLVFSGCSGPDIRCSAKAQEACLDAMT